MMTLEERQHLAEKFIPMARNIAKKYRERYIHEYDRLESEALYALTKSAMNFDKSRKVKFATYARFRIVGAMIDMERKIYEQMGEEILYEDIAYDNHQHDFEMDDAAMEILKGLPERHKKVVYDVVVLGKGRDTISKEIGTSPTTITNLYNQSMEMLRGEIVNNGHNRESRTRPRT